MQDPNVVQRLKRGDGAALKTIFRSSAQRAFVLAFRMTGNREMSEEVVKAVFEELWHKRRDIDPLQDLASTILRETYLCVRALQRERTLVTPPLPASTDPRLQPLIEGVERLNETQRLAYLLHSAEGFSHREIARTLDVSDEAVVTLIAKALQELEVVVQQSVL